MTITLFCAAIGSAASTAGETEADSIEMWSTSIIFRVTAAEVEGSPLWSSTTYSTF